MILADGGSRPHVAWGMDGATSRRGAQQQAIALLIYWPVKRPRHSSHRLNPLGTSISPIKAATIRIRPSSHHRAMLRSSVQVSADELSPKSDYISRITPSPRYAIEKDSNSL